MKFCAIEDPDGKRYEVETDETLEKEGIPADAAAVGYKISANFNIDYSLDTPDTCFGFLNIGGGNGIFRTWVCDNNIAGVLIEGFAGFVGKKAVTAEVFRANEEQMVNWLITVSYYLSV